jgi:hypothetical protein
MGISSGSYILEPVPDSLLARQETFEQQTGYLCKQCYDKYELRISEELNDIWITRWADIKNDRQNVKSRKHWEQVRREEKLQDFDRAIEVAKKQKEDYLHPPPPDTMKSHGWFQVDTCYPNNVFKIYGVDSVGKK